LTSKHQKQVRMRLTDAVFARMVVDVRTMIESMPPEHKAGVDGNSRAAQRDFEMCDVSVSRLSRWRNTIR